MKFTREDVLRVAELAHLELSAAEVETFRGQLDSILEYIEKLNQLDTSQVEPMAGGRPAGVAVAGEQAPSSDDPGGALRADTPWPTAPIEPAEALKAAPDSSSPFFRVPKVIERQ